MARAGSALFQSDYGRQGNFELLVTNNRSTTLAGASSGALAEYRRDNDAGMVWRYAGVLTSFDSAGSESTEFPVRPEHAYRNPCWIEATDRNFHGICVLGSAVYYFAKEPFGSWIIPPPPPPRAGAPVPAVAAGSVLLPTNCSGAPAFLQSTFGRNGNFEVVVPVSTGGIDHFWMNNDSGLPRRLPGAVLAVGWNRAGHFGRGNLVEGVRLIHSDFGNLEAIALERTGTGRELVFYWQNGAGGPWSAGDVLPGSDRAAGVPGFIQSTFQSVPGQGNLEVVAPSVDGGLIHWFSFISPTGRVWQRAPDVNRGGTRVGVVHLIQSNYGGNFEVIAETGASPYGFGSLVFYWFNSGTWTWNGPYPVRPV